jgi:hypothetical protein
MMSQRDSHPPGKTATAPPQDFALPQQSKTGKKLKPGQPGTKKLMHEYGDKLVCVRYRYDFQNRKRLTTVELIVEEAAWQPATAEIPPDRIMPVRIQYGEVALGVRVKAAGGKWNREKKFWELPYQEIVNLGLRARIIAGAHETTNHEGMP